MTAPLVTIIVATYDQEDFVRDAIESALAQTYPNIEVLVDDNGSTDQTPAILEGYRSDPRVTLRLHAENAALSKRLNDAVATARGEFISLLFGDDYYFPTKIARQVEEFSRLPRDYGVVYGPGYRSNVLTGARWLEFRGGRSGWIIEDVFRDYTGGWFISPIAPLVRHECFERYKWHEDVPMEGEAIFFFVALSFRFRYLDEPFVVMREHQRNLGKAYRSNFESEMRALDKLERHTEFPTRLLPLVSAARAARQRTLGWQLIRIAGEPAAGRRLLLRSVRRRPVSALHPRTIVGVVLSLLPAGALRWVNAAVNQVRRHRENIAFLQHG